jgi:hypothetical protein
VSGHDFSRADEAPINLSSRGGLQPDEGSAFTTFSNLFGRADKAFHSFLILDPGDWKWSSFRHYAFREMGVVEIESEWTGRDRELKVNGGQPRVFLCPS